MFLYVFMSDAETRVRDYQSVNTLYYAGTRAGFGLYNHFTDGLTYSGHNNLLNLPSQNGVILAPDHDAYWDIPVYSGPIRKVLDKPVRFMTKTELFDGSGIIGRLVEHYFRQVGCIEAGRTAADLLSPEVFEAFREISLYQQIGCIMGQGTRKNHAEDEIALEHFHAGLAILATQLGMDVATAAAVGTVNRSYMHVHYGETVPVEQEDLGLEKLIFADKGTVDDSTARRILVRAAKHTRPLLKTVVEMIQENVETAKKLQEQRKRSLPPGFLRPAIWNFEP